MSYVIHFDKWGYPDEEYRNLTWEEVCSDDAALAETEAFEYWLNENYEDEGLDASEIAQGLCSNEDFDVSELMEHFRNSDSYYEIQDGYTPIYNYVHVLMSEPTSEEILLVDKYVGNVVVVEIDSCDTCVLALTGCGMDLSDNIEMAYYLTDGESPVRASQIMSLSTEAEAMLHHFRSYAKEFGRVSPIEVSNFIKEYNDGKEKPMEQKEASSV